MSQEEKATTSKCLEVTKFKPKEKKLILCSSLRIKLLPKVCFQNTFSYISLVMLPQRIFTS